MHQQKGGKGGYFHCLLSVQLTECRPVDGGGEERGRERERWRVGGGGQLYLAGEASCAWASWRRAGDGFHNPTCCLHKTPFATKHTHPLAPILLSISCL